MPYEVSGQADVTDMTGFMLVCRACNRTKSWACEHCQNWQADKNISTCQTCYWASPQNYTHVALELIKRVDLIWKADEIMQYQKLKEKAEQNGMTLNDYIKQVLDVFPG